MDQDKLNKISRKSIKDHVVREFPAERVLVAIDRLVEFAANLIRVGLFSVGYL